MSRRLRLIAVALPLFVVVAHPGCHRPTPPPETGLILVTVAKPVVKLVTQFTDLTGVTRAKDTVKLYPRVAGYIVKAAFEKEGKLVKAGDVLFEIDPTVYDAQVKQAQAQISVAKAKLEKANADYVRQEALKGATTQEQIDQAKAEVGVQKANKEAAEAEMIQAKQNLEWTKVTAPIDGRMDRVYLTPGNVATTSPTTGATLTTIVSVDPMFAYLDVDERSVLAYKKLIDEKKAVSVADGGTVPVEIQLTGEKTLTHKGTLDFVSNQIDPQTGSLQLRVTIPNKDAALGPGLFVKAKIPLGQPAEGILIPDASVVSDQGNKIVYVVGANNKIEAKKVELGPLSDGLRVVLSGLGKDDRVVIRGMQRVQAGITVEPQDGTIAVPTSEK